MTQPTKQQRRRIIGLGLILALIALGIRWEQQHSKKESARLSNLSPSTGIRPATLPVSKSVSQMNPSTPVYAATTARYKDSVVIASRETLSDQNKKLRVEIVKTRMKYPFLRIVSRIEIDPISGKEKIRVIEEAAADHVLVQLQAGKTEKDLLDTIGLVDGKIFRKLRLDAPTYIVSLPEPSLDAVPEAVTRLSAFGELLEVVEPDYVVHNTAVPNDPRFREQWGLNNSGQTGGVPDADIDAPEAWNIHQGTAVSVVALSDGGVDYTHADLSANMWVNTGEIPNNFYDDDGNGFVDDYRGWDFYDFHHEPFDYDGHGTFVAGIIGAKGNNGVGIAGVCWSCRIMGLRTLGVEGGYHSDVAQGFDYARNMGAKTINASHSGSSVSSIVQNAIKSLENAGVVLVTAAGNQGLNLDLDPVYPACYPNKNIITVASSNKENGLDDFSNYGFRNVDLAAPGSEILSTRLGNRYTISSGTSFSAPHVAGACALLRSFHPEWSYLQVRNAILNNVDYLVSVGDRCSSGGRLNLRRALIGAISLPTALDTTLFTWTTGGAAGWFGETRETHDGVDGAESGEILDNRESWLQTTIHGPGTLSFWWQSSSEYEADYFEFSINGETRGRISGDTGWMEENVTLGTGAHVVRWRYSKDYSISEGRDHGWVDQVRFVGEPPSGLTISPSIQNVLPGGTATFSVTAAGTPNLRYQWRKNGVKISGATSSALRITGLKATNAGVYSVVVTNLWGAALSGNSTLNVCTYAMTPDKKSFGSNGGAGSVAITSVCPWTVTTSNSWITITSPNGNGNGVAAFTVAPNTTGVTRAGRITVNGAVCLVTQFPELAPALGGGKTFSMTISNGLGGLATSGLYQITLSSTTNLYWKTSLNPSEQGEAGFYAFARLTSSNANLSLSSTNGRMDFALHFHSLVEGTFLATNQAGGGQNGSFHLLASRPDMNFDGQPDLLLQHTNGQLATWFMKGTNMVGNKMLRNGMSPGAAWKVLGLGDFNDDQAVDIVFQHTDGRLIAWLMNGTNFLGSALLRGGVSAGAWRGAGLSDFNNDGQSDVLFQHPDGRLAVWFMQQTNFASSQLLRDGLAVKGWSLAGVNDFNADGQADLLWQNPSGAAAVWFLVGIDFLGSTSLRNGAASGVGWQAVALEDVNGDGQNDIIWQHVNGKLAAWLMKGTDFAGSLLLRNGTPVAPGWRVMGPK